MTRTLFSTEEKPNTDLMKRLVVINSFGPMGSTLLAGLIEKFGFSNIPLRKLKLHQYMMGEIDLQSGTMQDRLGTVLKEHSKPILMGGAGVIDRNNQPYKVLVDGPKAELLLNQLKNTEFENVGDLYIACREVYCQALAYKISTHRPGWHIKLTVDIHHYDPAALYARYREEFDIVHMIHLHRDLKSWINSFASQSLVHPKWKKRLSFMPYKYEKEYVQYEQAVEKIPGLHIHFNDLFKTPIEKLAEDLTNFLGLPMPDLNLREELYDMYSKSLPYQKAFTPFDSQFIFLRSSTLAYFENLSHQKKFSKRSVKILAWMRYVIDMLAYRLRVKKSRA